MKVKKFFYLALVIIFSGCATAKEVQPPQEPIRILEEEEVQVKEVSSAPESEERTEEDSSEAEEIQTQGIVFAKTEFEGVLKTNFVRLFLEHQENEKNKFQLHFGEKETQQIFPWEVKRVEPGYFFIELPSGPYTMSAVSIPVGTTMASEEMNITFEVVPDEVVYLGTLRMVGTKEKIKLGGVPVIKPGFEFNIEILNEEDQGLVAFEQNYPDVTKKVIIQLMQQNPISVP